MPSSHKRQRKSSLPPHRRRAIGYDRPRALPHYQPTQHRRRRSDRTSSSDGISLLLFVVVICVIGYLIIHAGGAPSLVPSPHASSPPEPPHVVRLAQNDPQQFDENFPMGTWEGASCSGAAMAEVMNRYDGKQRRTADVLKVEDQLGVITSDLGLLELHGIDKTVAKFGFRANWIKNATIDKVIAAANAGTPVIINIPAESAGTLYPGGHFLVVIDGSANRAETVDSSRLNIKTWTLGQPRDSTHYDLLDYYTGLAVLVQPAGAS